ncbi:TetR/AcrR family transcriptional regulator [Kordiimonas aquimaris]|uniref:TetR/AcrR family transcriptional regulator n=1 Tax=Kordiimonas aquimaris TaxID=707591 RepID=UPI0021D12452|nr:TetR/AcrR family transcriptional regulator [Kordiimonas aquimaris]
MDKIKTRPKQARAKARVETILNATHSLLINGKPEDVSTTAIARAANVPVGSIYQYFEDRNDILRQLYETAYMEVSNQVVISLKSIDSSIGFDAINRKQLHCFWQTARNHPTFRALTRWANHEYSFAEVTPGVKSGLGELIKDTLQVGGIELQSNRRDAVLQTTVTLVSALIDAAIEEDDEDKAQALIDELATVLSCYLG